jgi:hypothetical protein
MSNICPVCGYPDLFEPAYDDVVPSYEICPSCGYQFGFDDDCKHINTEEWRKKWIAAGMKWDDDTKNGRKQPVGWNPLAQLRNIGVEVR